MAGEDKQPSEPIIGIDLGMSSVIAAYVPAAGDPPRVIPAEKGQPTLAAVISFKDSNRPLVGRAAAELLTTAPDRTVTGVKRLLGRKSKSQAVRDLATRVGYSIIEGPESEVLIDMGPRKLRVPEVAAVLLDQVRRFAEAHLGEAVGQAVIAVPAYFNEAQKAAVREAALLAGLKVKKLVHEPTAVALAYGCNKGGDARIVIVDMGGVRLDVSVMEIAGNVFDVVATGGDPYLGGSNIDVRLVEWILNAIKKKHGRDLSKEPRLLQKVKTAAELAKRELSRCKAVDLQIPLSTGPKDQKNKLATIRLHLKTVEDLAEDTANRVIETIRRTLNDRGLRLSDIDDVILAGGATRMPLLRRKIEKLFGKEARANIPPEEVVALGAALLGESLRRDRAAASQDVVDMPIGIALADGRYMRIIEKDSKLPITRRVMIPTVRDNQHTMEVDLFKGESEDILETEYLGTIVYQQIGDGKAGEAKIIVDIALGTDRLLTVTSPEPGREGETFEIPAGSKEKNGGRSAVKPIFSVARGAPT